MDTYYELKDLICRILGCKQKTINDDDLELSISVPRYRSIERKYTVILKDKELKEVYEKVIGSNKQELELYNDNTYEKAVKIDYQVLRVVNLPKDIPDDVNHINYIFGLCSLEYCIYLLLLLIEKAGFEKKKPFSVFSIFSTPVII